MAYSKQTWTDGKAGATPITGARLQNIENGLGLAGQFLGSGSAFPTTGIQAGDMFIRTDVGINGTMYTYTGVSSLGVSGWIVENNTINCLNASKPTVGVYAGVNCWATDTLAMWVYTGTAWVGYAAVASDTGWVGLTLNSPTTSAGSGSAYRRVGNVVSVRMETNYNGGYGANFVFCNLPVGCRPYLPWYVQTTLYGGGTGNVYINTNGDIAVGTAFTTTGVIFNTTFLTA